MKLVVFTSDKKFRFKKTDFWDWTVPREWMLQDWFYLRPGIHGPPVRSNLLVLVQSNILRFSIVIGLGPNLLVRDPTVVVRGSLLVTMIPGNLTLKCHFNAKLVIFTSVSSDENVWFFRLTQGMGFTRLTVLEWCVVTLGTSHFFKATFRADMGRPCDLFEVFPVIPSG